MGFLDRFRRKKEGEPLASPAAANRPHSRGTILDVITDSDDIMGYRRFSTVIVSGVEYESSQAIGVEQQKNKTRYIQAAWPWCATTRVNLQIQLLCERANSSQ